MCSSDLLASAGTEADATDDDAVARRDGAVKAEGGTRDEGGHAEGEG